jgi:uncharacterized membrane protein YphA (DoxX/SURF4 family)
MKKLISFFSLAAAVLLPINTFAHEVYVLTKDQVQEGFRDHYNVFIAWKNIENIKLTLIISVCIGIVLVLNFLFRHSTLGHKLRSIVERGRVFGPLFVRLAVSLSFFFSALQWSFLGPELSLHDFPYGEIVRIVMFALSGMFFFGLFVEVASLIGLAIYILAFYQFGFYMLAYFNYLGEFIVLILFGLRVFSLDRVFFGPLNRLKEWEKYKTTVVRICYGIALCFAAIYIKILNPNLTLAVVNEYDLTRFSFLFPQDPLMVVLGAAMAEVTLGIFIIIGFQLRFAVLVTLFYLTLSLIFFREAVWPHLLLYGISFSLIFDKEVFTVDNFLDKYFAFGKNARKELGK